MSLAEVIACCASCHRGYVMVNWENQNPSCHACAGPLKAITPRPNEWPHVRGAFVNLSAEDRASLGIRPTDVSKR
jgi:hypothetical protein